jgi:hypothetical protein
MDFLVPNERKIVNNNQKLNSPKIIFIYFW